MREYVIKQGESMTSIARRFGFTDPMAIYNDPANAALRKLRPHPNLLYPGDTLVIPDRKTKTVTCATDTVHKFQVTLPRKCVRLVLRDGENKTLEGVRYELVVGNQTFRGTTKSDGLIEAQIHACENSATLSLNGGAPEPIAIDHLNPMHDTTDGGLTGVQARLRNLGYLDVPVDGIHGPLTRTAIWDFEERHGMTPTGEISDSLIKKLEQQHGC